MATLTSREILRFDVSVDNDRQLEGCLQHEKAVCAQINQNAVQDAKFYSRTRRIKTPSPAAASDSVPKLSRGGDEDRSRTLAGSGLPSVPKEFSALLSQVVISLSSDSEREFCRCKELLNEESKEQRLMCTEITVSHTKLDLIADNEGKRGKSSSSGGSKSDFHEEEKALRANSRRSKNLRASQRRQRRALQTHRVTSFQKRRTVSPVKIDTNTMATSEDDMHQVQRRLTRNNAARPNTRQTRTSTKSNTLEKRTEEKEVADMPSGSMKRRSPVSKGVKPLKGQRKGNTISPKVMDVVFGKMKNSTADLEELRQKREQDLLKCGRVPRTVGHVVTLNHNNLSKSTSRTVEDDTSKRNMTSSFTPECDPSTLSKPPVLQSNQVFKEGDTAIDEPVGASNDIDDVPFLNGGVKGSSETGVQHVVTSPNASPYGVRRDVVDDFVVYDTDMESLHPSEKVSEDQEQQGRSASPSIRSREYYLESREGREDETSTRERPIGRDRSYDSGRGNGRPHLYMTSGRRYSRSPRRSRSRSPAYDKIREERRRDSKYGQVSNKRSSSDKHIGGSWSGRRDIVMDTVGNRCNKDFSSNQSEYRHHRSLSPYSSRRDQRRGSASKSRSPSVSLLPTSRDVLVRNEAGLETGKAKEVAISQSSIDRRTRRHKQAVRESETCERQGEGKKPFYLTLDSERRPFGLGKPAWVAEVNKLSSGLDPSCTHIKKQTHESMCILKKRLDERFEYAGDLNEDYLRGLLGKAVTRRRTKLIAMINKNEKRPVTVDEKVWKRLEKIACCRQRQERSEHGRYANSCRQTLGRTGSLGIEGVRQKLHEMLGRSPDPDEVAEEMQRDKGYGKTQLSSRTLTLVRSESYSDEDDNHAETHVRSRRSQSQEYCTDEGLQKTEELRRTSVLQTNNTLFEKNLGDVGRTSGGRVIQKRAAHATDLSITAKDKYIARLEAELQGLRTSIGKGSSFEAVHGTECRGRPVDRIIDVPMGYAGESSATRRRESLRVEARVVERRIVPCDDEL